MSVKKALAYTNRIKLYTKPLIPVLLNTSERWDIKSPESPHLHKSWKLSDHNPIIRSGLPFLAEHKKAETQRKQEEE